MKIPSFSGKEEAVCRKIASLCTEAGFDEVRFDGLGSVIARVGKGPRKLAIDAHVDTVGVGDPSRWATDPFSGIVRDGLVLGRGTADQKGGAAAMITAGRILKNSGYDGEFSVYFTFTVLEEDCDGLCWRYLIEKEGLRPEFAVSTEPTSCRLYRGQRGRMEIEAVVRGVSAHGSAPERGQSAAYKAARAALAMEKMNERLAVDEFLGKGTVVVSKIDVHGPSQCAVPDQGMLYLDRRLTWGETAEQALAQVREAMAADAEKVSMPWYDGEGLERRDATARTCTSPRGRSPRTTRSWPAERTRTARCSEGCPRSGSGPSAPTAWPSAASTASPASGSARAMRTRRTRPNEHTRIDDLVTASAFYAMLPLALEEKHT